MTEAPADAPADDLVEEITNEDTTYDMETDEITNSNGADQESSMTDNLRDEGAGFPSGESSAGQGSTGEGTTGEEVMGTGYVFGNVDILIKDVENTLDGEVFIATVVNDPNGHFSANQEIRVSIANGEFPDFEIDTRYVVDLLNDNAKTSDTELYIVNDVK